MQTGKLYETIEAHSQGYIQKLREAVQIPSVSGDLSKRQDVVHMADWLESEMTSLGIQ